jgi:Na+/proline symporter
MADFMSNFFGPLDKSVCAYFLIVSVIFFIALIVVSIGEILFLMKNYSRMDLRMITVGVLLLFNVFLAYFVNRMFYNMCTRSLA